MQASTVKQLGVKPPLATVDPNVKLERSHTFVAVAQLVPGAGGGVAEVMQIWKFPLAPKALTSTHTWVPVANDCVTKAESVGVLPISQYAPLPVKVPQPPVKTATPTVCAAGAPVGLTVIVFMFPLVIKVNHTSLVQLACPHMGAPHAVEVAPMLLPLIQTLPEAGITIGVAFRQSSFKGWATTKLIETAKKQRVEISLFM